LLKFGTTFLKGGKKKNVKSENYERKKKLRNKKLVMKE